MEVWLANSCIFVVLQDYLKKIHQNKWNEIEKEYRVTKIDISDVINLCLVKWYIEFFFEAFDALLQFNSEKCCSINEIVF